MTPSDQTTVELTQAWAHAYGRSPDPSDVWDHAIKAVESILQPVVLPNDSKATLGKVLAALSTGSYWKTVFPGDNKDGDVTNLVAALRLIWPNPDRHGRVLREPTLQEARAVVNLAVALVQCHRDGGLILHASRTQSDSFGRVILTWTHRDGAKLGPTWTPGPVQSPPRRDVTYQYIIGSGPRHQPTDAP